MNKLPMMAALLLVAVTADAGKSQKKAWAKKVTAIARQKGCDFKGVEDELFSLYPQMDATAGGQANDGLGLHRQHHS